MQGVKWNCEENSHNDLATAFWSTPDDLLSRLFSVGHEDTKEPTIDNTGFTQLSLLLYSLIYLSMLALCAGVCVPAGMFMPAVMLGAASGLAAGVELQRWLPGYHIQPGMRPATALAKAHSQCLQLLWATTPCSLCYLPSGLKTPLSESQFPSHHDTLILRSSCGCLLHVA